MDDTVRRAERMVALMNERIRSRTPQERDRLMQQFLAQAMTPQQRFRAVGMLMNLGIALSTRTGGSSNAGNAFLDLMNAVTESVDAHALPYAIAGTIATGIHGEPRTSYTVEICLGVTLKQAAKLADLLPSRFRCLREAMPEAASSWTKVHLIDIQTEMKIDLSVLSDDSYCDQVLRRRRRVEYSTGGMSFWIVSAEDVILMKLLWRKGSGSQKQWDNALSVVRTRGASLDWKYLRHWAGRLGVSNDMEKLRDEGGV